MVLFAKEQLRRGGGNAAKRWLRFNAIEEKCFICLMITIHARGTTTARCNQRKRHHITPGTGVDYD